MRPSCAATDARPGPRSRLDLLEGLPLRYSSLRALVADRLDPVSGAVESSAPRAPTSEVLSFDPGFRLARLRWGPEPDVGCLAALPLWEPALGSSPLVSAFVLHAVAASRAAWHIARERGLEARAEGLSDLALLRDLGLWAILAVDPAGADRLLSEPDPVARARVARVLYGLDQTRLGHALAVRWLPGHPLAEVVWSLQAERPRSGTTSIDAEAVSILRKARLWADSTPWAHDREPAIVGRMPPARGLLRRLVAEVQALCAAPFFETAGQTEAALSRRMLGTLARHEADSRRAARRARFLEHLVAPGNLDTGASSVAAGDETAPTDDPLLDAAREAQSRQLREHEWLSATLDQLHDQNQDLASRHQQQRVLDRLSAMAEFAAGAAHEVNNPLAVITGRAQLLLAQAATPESARSLRTIMAQAQRAHRMLRDLIYIARPPQPRPRRCQPDAVLREVAADLRREAADRRVQLRIRIAPEPVAAWAEPDHLRHLADALLRNALEATPPGQSVRVVGRSRPGALDWTITDRGRGLTDHEARCLFDPFFSGREAGRGLGLGLSRAARFVELQGGQIRWQSTSGRGTTFSVRIPLPTRDPTPPPAVPPPPHFAPRPSPTTGAG